MFHLYLSEEEMAIRHPSILAPDEEPLHDLQHDDDNVFMHGCKIAVAIRCEVDNNGRRRHYATATVAAPVQPTLAVSATTGDRPKNRRAATPELPRNLREPTGHHVAPPRQRPEAAAGFLETTVLESEIQDLRDQVAANIVKIRQAPSTGKRLQKLAAPNACEFQTASRATMVSTTPGRRRSARL